MSSRQPRKQRKDWFTAPLHKRRKRLASHMAEDLMVKYNKRSVPIVRGDTVKVIRGNFKNHVDKVHHVDLKRQHIEVEGVVTTKVDGSKVPRPIHPSNVIITKLNLTDSWRLERLERGLTEEVKREIEQEAQQQIIDEQREAERRKEEALAAEAEEQIAAEVEDTEESQEDAVSSEEALPEPSGEEAEREGELESSDMSEPEKTQDGTEEISAEVKEPKTALDEAPEEAGPSKKKKSQSKGLSNEEVEG